MSRVTNAVASRNRRKKILKMAAGYRGRSNNCFRPALQRVEKALQYAYRDRRVRKREFRSLWIQRINAAARACGMKYSVFMSKLKQSGLLLNRKSISELAIQDWNAFEALVKSVS